MKKLFRTENLHRLKEFFNTKAFNRVKGFFSRETLNRLKKIFSMETVNRVKGFFSKETLNRFKKLFSKETVNRIKEFFTAESLRRLKETLLKKKVILPSVAALLAIIVMIGFFSGKGAFVMEVIGNVAITRDHKIHPAKDGSVLKKGDTVSAEEASSAWIRLDEHKTILLVGAGELQCASIKKNITLLLASGSILVRNDAPLKQGESFEILLGTLKLTVNETAVFSVQLDSADNAVLNVYQGKVTVYDVAGKALIALDKGLSITLDPQAGELISEAEPIDYQALNGVIAEYVRDYANEAETAEEPPPSPAPESSAPSPETQDEPELPEVQEDIEEDQEALPESSTPQSDLPQPETAPTPAVDSGSDQPSVTFRYIWTEKEFKPYADILWPSEQAEYILWQLYDQNNNAITEEVRLEKDGGVVSRRNYAFDVPSRAKNNLYPKGYTIRLTPYYTPEGGAAVQSMAPIVMELPYFEVAAERNGTALTPVISTNIGFYFIHSHGNLTDTEENGRLRIRGSLVPIEGEKVPLEIDVISK